MTEKRETRPFKLAAIAAILVLVALLVLAAAGCDDSSDGGCDAPTPSPTPVPTPAPSPTPGPTPVPSPTTTPTPAPNGACAVQYTVNNEWATGFAVEVTISNPANTAVRGYTLTWRYSAGQKVTSFWNVTITQSGTDVSASNPASSYNGTIAPYGGSVQFGFQGTHTGANPVPTQFTLNGQPCASVGPGPTPGPTPQPTLPPRPTPPPSGQTGTDGYATRYWDCCKPHCGWTANVPAGVNPVGTCNFDNVANGVSDMIKSSCDGGDGFTCWNMAPYAVSDTLAYGYAAVSAAGDICGKCYQLDFKGTTHNAGDDPGSKALAGKTMIVQATNIGYDVSNGQIDLLVPGGGVGAFDACTQQWGATAEQMGQRYGGFLLACKQELGWNAGHDAYKSCVMQRCEDLFAQPGMQDLLDGCRWFVDWFEAADNPALVFKEVACPEALNDVSGMLP